ncbi:hypothetical protein H101_07945 [Trichophyton interdigitale H6]|nr:hypothetical protein H101_07945 [Trichophyton interdigitale H6]
MWKSTNRPLETQYYSFRSNRNRDCIGLLSFSTLPQSHDLGSFKDKGELRGNCYPPVSFPEAKVRLWALKSSIPEFVTTFLGQLNVHGTCHMALLLPALGVILD